MSTNQFTEDSYEQTLIDLFKRMGYQYECGYDVERDFREPWYVADLQQSLRNPRPWITLRRDREETGRDIS